MLDTSSSIRGRFQFEQDSAIAFLLQVMHRNDRAFVEGFDVETDVAQGFTNNIDLLDQGIQKLRPGGGTALFDALYSTCKDQMLTLQRERRGAQGASSWSPTATTTTATRWSRTPSRSASARRRSCMRSAPT